MATDDSIWTVWVGGTEVNDHYLTKEGAEALALSYSDYDDVCITKVED